MRRSKERLHEEETPSVGNHTRPILNRRLSWQLSAIVVLQSRHIPTDQQRTTYEESRHPFTKHDQGPLKRGPSHPFTCASTPLLAFSSLQVVCRTELAASRNVFPQHIRKPGCYDRRFGYARAMFGSGGRSKRKEEEEKAYWIAAEATDRLAASINCVATSNSSNGDPFVSHEDNTIRSSTTLSLHLHICSLQFLISWAPWEVLVYLLECCDKVWQTSNKGGIV